MAELRERISRYEDAGHGDCYLRDERIAELVQNALFHFDSERYRLLTWCIMPNHVHVLIETMQGWPLGDVVHSWKSFTAKEANKVLGRSGEFWMKNYFDRFIRDESHFAAVKEYIENNPVKAGLCSSPEEWRFSASGSRENAPETGAFPGAFPGLWKGAQGLAEDVRYYGKWMRDEAEKRIGHLYPKIEVIAEMAKERPDLKKYVGQKLTVIAWLWARTVKSPNPAFAQVDVPLVSTFMLSTKPGKEAYVEPVLGTQASGLRKTADGTSALPGYRFTVKVGKPKDPDVAKNGTKSGGNHSAFLCLMSRTPMPFDYIRNEAKTGRMGTRLMAIVAEGERGRVYLSPTPEMEALPRQAKPKWMPDCEMPKKHRNFQPPVYGMNNFGDIFTPRQLVALTIFCDLVEDVRRRVKCDALAAGQPDEEMPLSSGGTGANAYADALGVYLAFAVDKGSNYWSSLCSWHSGRDTVTSTFGRQALPMVWDFAEANPFSESSGNYLAGIDQAKRQIQSSPAMISGSATQADAAIQSISYSKVVSTDPPYYDNIAYADLSDFFYVWLRRSLKAVFPDLFATVAVPKAEELIVAPNRHGSKAKAEAFFLDGMTQAMHRLAEQAHPAFPITIYYAFKQAENLGTRASSPQEDAAKMAAVPGVASTGWETFLDAVIRAGFAITGTWPVRTEYTGNLKKNMSALASSIVLVCRPREANAPTATRREFLTALKAELPAALAHLQGLGPRDSSPHDATETVALPGIAPVDLAQAAIGPGMAIYTRYAKVLDADGKPLSVREALSLINQILDEALAEQEGDFDADSRFAVAWFDQSGFAEGEYGIAEVLSKAKNTSVSGMVEAGVLASGHGKVRLLRPEELSADWDPEKDERLTAWEMVHQLIRALEAGGEGAAAALVAKLGSKAEIARELAYRLYTLCERKKRAAEALTYNGLVQSWPEIMRLGAGSKKPGGTQTNIFGIGEE